MDLSIGTWNARLKTSVKVDFPTATSKGVR